MRIVAGGIAIECATFSPLLTELGDFSVLRGDDLRGRYPFTADYPDVSLVPLLHARAVPGGPVRKEAYETLKQEFMDRLQTQSLWDGVYLDMHGAMYVEGMEDAEGDWIAAVREIVGPDCLISASYDLHGNVSRRVIENVDLLTAYRTAPHEDAPETRHRAFALLVDCLRRGVRPHRAFIPIPMMLSGERTMTIVEPGRGVYDQIGRVTQAEGVWDASILVGYTWADEPRSHACAIALGTDRTQVNAAARHLAQSYWDARHKFTFGMPTGSVDECIRMAVDASESTVFLSDSGDNVTGGAVGDVPYVLERLIAHNAPKSIYASIVDPAAVETCFAAGEGKRVHLMLGGKLDAVHGKPLEVWGRVHYLYASEHSGRQVIVELPNIHVIVTERRLAFTTLQQFTDLGIDLLDYRIVCLKLGYLFPDFQRIAPKAIMALSPGAINAWVETLPFERIQRPMYPFDPDMQWAPESELEVT